VVVLAGEQGAHRETAGSCSKPADRS